MIRIIIADDHDIIRSCFIALFENIPDCKIIAQAADGEEVVALARELKPDVILMDYKMPELNGVEATKQIKSENPEIKIIGLSMHTADFYIKEFLEAGADTYLLKDSGIAEIQRTIREIYENSRV